MSISASVIAHGVHYAVLGVGLLGLAFLIGPQLFGARSQGADDEHRRRVRMLGEQIAEGSLGTTLTAFPVVLAPRTPPAAADRARSSLLQPVAIVSSAAAAGVHGAVGPEHFRESLLFGLFFAGSALAQIVWAGALVTRPSRALLEIGAVGNLAVVCLWAATRTVGLGPLLPHPEAVGPWDVCCGAWELCTVATCIALLRHRADVSTLRLARWADWHPGARAWALGSVLLLGLLTVSGAGA